MKEVHSGTHVHDYSLAQMDNFYQAFAAGKIKPTSIMNYIQHLFIAQCCLPGNHVLDVCCGRGLQVPLLKHVVPALGGYVGIDISEQNLEEAATVIRYGDGHIPIFPCDFIHGDVTTDLVQLHSLFDVIIYTSALEHMEKARGIQSLIQIAHVLHPQGTFYLSTPCTPHTFPPALQHRVHIYEWDQTELEEELMKIGFEVIARYGLLPSGDNSQIITTLNNHFGSGASLWFEEMQKSIPAPFLGPFVASALPEIATELLYVCRWQQQQ
ncbi:class I SAM-dependent methyltransferase [Ktedonobacteria bacterium brp13]|nr:class I SAM-dependent methyltransferase [Ktedonobacteria bacterium brp13]